MKMKLGFLPVAWPLVSATAIASAERTSATGANQNQGFAGRAIKVAIY